MALEATQSLTEMSIRNLLGGKGQPARKADTLTATYEPTEKCGRLDMSQPYGPSRPVNRDNFFLRFVTYRHTRRILFSFGTR
jgi:hypothetical protein